VADSIAVGNPRDVIKACKYMEESGGEFITVTDDEIIKGIREMTEQTGIFAEPAGAAPYAGFRKLQLEGKLGEECSVCIVATGNGLKDISAVEKLINRRTYSKDEARKI
jgi:threonine synthase